MNESLCEACGFNHTTDSCRDTKAIARWREALKERSEVSALWKRMDERVQRERLAPFVSRIAELERERDEARQLHATGARLLDDAVARFTAAEARVAELEAERTEWAQNAAETCQRAERAESDRDEAWKAAEARRVQVDREQARVDALAEAARRAQRNAADVYERGESPQWIERWYYTKARIAVDEWLRVDKEMQAAIDDFERWRSVAEEG